MQWSSSTTHPGFQPSKSSTLQLVLSQRATASHHLLHRRTGITCSTSPCLLCPQTPSLCPPRLCLLASSPADLLLRRVIQPWICMNLVALFLLLRLLLNLRHLPREVCSANLVPSAVKDQRRDSDHLWTKRCHGPHLRMMEFLCHGIFR